MYQTQWLGVITVLIMPFLFGEATLAADLQSCGSTSNKTGQTYKVNGSGINVWAGPGTSFDRIVNQKATRIMGKTHYVTIDNSVTVFEECSQGEWSRIHVTDPDYLSQSHRGWVESKVLRGKKVDSSGVEVFTEADFSFDDKTQQYENIIIAGVNKIHRENARCKDIDASSAYISSSKGSASNPVFYVTCGKDAQVFNVFFSKSDVENDKQFRARQHISKSNATDLCEGYAKSSASHPSTVDFSRIMDLSIYETPNGRTRVTSTFTAKNSFNLELKYVISCLLDNNGLIEADITESQ